MREYNETELKNKIDAFLTRKLSTRFGSSLRFKADYLDRTKAIAAVLLHSQKSDKEFPFKRHSVPHQSQARYLMT